MREGGRPVKRSHVAQLRLERQGLLGDRCESAADVVDRLGQIQVDPMNVIAQSARIVLWSRCPSFRQADFNSLYSDGPRVFEYWTRIAAMLSMELYPLVAPVMARRRTDSYWDRWVSEFLNQQKAVVDSVLSEVESRGPLASRDFPTDKETAGRWGSMKTAKEALEALWYAGELMVCERRRGEKVFDLTSRVLPKGIEPADLPEDERIAALWRSVLRQLGACATGELANYFGTTAWPEDRKLKPEDVSRMARAAGFHAFSVEGTEAEWLCLPEDADRLYEKPAAPPRRVTLLSPFDNVATNRWILSELFGFDYKFEAYTPKTKRQYGAYVLPILRGTTMIGRLDPKFERKQSALVVNGVWLEPKVKPSQALAQSLAKTLRSFAEFLGAEEVRIAKTEPSSLKADLVKAL